MGLGIQMPCDTFTVSDVMDYVGPHFPLDVIDVARQENIRMPMSEWVEYFNSPIRSKVYNVISLEFTKTRLSELVKPPTIVQKLSWVENYWPRNSELHTQFCPQVMKYCLMSARDSYTDFHIDFGGTSVWYHVLRGEKMFFLIQPTAANLALYEHWMASSNQSETFFGDQVDVCYQMLLTHGQTLFIPTGWIHAVLTPADSLVFGGNFLHSLNIPLQLHIHEMEKRINTPDKYKFPTFETVHWFAAPHILDQLKDNNLGKRELAHLASGAKALVSVLKIWSSDSQNHKHDDVPHSINVTKLIKDLQREVRIAEKYASGKNPMLAARKPPQRLKKKELLFAPKAQSPTESEKNMALISKFSLKPRDDFFGKEERKESVYDFVESDDDDNLVVDERPAEPLRLRLSINVKPDDVPKSATIDDLLVATGLADTSLDDDLSGGRTSPSTREAIQGMLSISKSAFLFPEPAPPAPPPLHMDNSLANFSILARKSTAKRYVREEDDFEEHLKQCHQDGDYIYLGLEGSDDECHVFKPRGRSRRDEPWSPRAKLVPNCPKPERPVREGVRKEAIECGLAAAAAKLATMPPPKRQYLKKKTVGKSKAFSPEQQAGPSNSLWNNKRPLLPEPPKVNKKPKKGFATAKQRLGKILKIHKMLY